MSAASSPSLLGFTHGVGQRGEFCADYGAFANMSLSAGRAYATRWTPSKSRTLQNLSFLVSTADTADNAVHVGLYDAATGTKLFDSGAVTGKLNSTGQKLVSCTATVAAGVPVYAAILVPTITTSVLVCNVGLLNGDLVAAVGSATGEPFMAYVVGQSVLPAALSAFVTLPATPNSPLLIARDA